MKTLVIYYSRTGSTRAVARRLADALGAETEELVDSTDRSGIRGYLRAGREAWFRRRTELAPLRVRLGDFDLIVVGTPIWNYSVSVPVRTFLADHAGELPEVAFFCTMGSRGSRRVFRQMEELCHRPPIATFARTQRQLASKDLARSIAGFASELRAWLGGRPAAGATTADATKLSQPPTVL